MILIGQIAGVAGVIPPLQGKPAENLKFPQSQSGDKWQTQSLHSLSKNQDQPSQLTRTVNF